MASAAKRKRAVASKTANAVTPAQEASGRQDALSLLRADHRKVEELFRQYEAADSNMEEQERLVAQICDELTIHSVLEEELFYPACRERGVGTERLDEAQVEHDGVKLLVAELRSQSPDKDFYDAKVAVLSRYVRDHIQEEEQASDGIFAQAKKHKVDFETLGHQLQERKTELMQQSEASRFRLTHIRSLDLRSTQQLQQETHMTQERYRDERGRFESDDERGRSGGDRGRSGWYGDPEGHARASERGWEERGGSRGYSSRSRDDDDDDGYSSRGGGRGHGRGGWFGDSEGHSRAAERGYEEGRRPGGWFGDSERHSRASERAWEEGRRPGGWFGDSEGHSRASERGCEEGRRPGGWFGDPEGHARASERGWEERGSSRGYSSRSRDDDDEYERSSRGGGRGHGRGGWHGDSEGHSRAFERGWEERRSR
jgi:hemerythrin superfamily protein